MYLYQLLSYNNGKTIGQNAFPSTLQTLDLTNNSTTFLQDGVFQDLNNLTSLRLHGNQLFSVSRGTWKGLGSLQLLDLHYNKIQTLPANIFLFLKSLETLKLDLIKSTVSAQIFGMAFHLFKFWN